MKIAIRSLDQGIFQQMIDSQQMKSWLIATHANQMSNFQHLCRTSDLQRRNSEKLTDFAGRLENTLREATIHIKNKFQKDNTKEQTVDTAILLVGAMLMSEKIKIWTPNIYSHHGKTMDNHYTAGGIASEVQRYLDRGFKTDNTTEHNAIAYYNQPQWPEKPKDTPRHQITINKLLPLNWDCCVVCCWKQNITQQSLFIWATFTVNGTTFSETAMQDSGCSSCIIPISQLPEGAKKKKKKRITHPDTLIKAINSSVTILGELNCDITIGDRNSPAFKEVNILVTSAITPILIGQNILSYRTLNSYSINNQDLTIEFKCSLRSGHTTHTAPLTSPQDYTTTSKHNPVYWVQTTFRTDSWHTTIPSPHGQTLEVKLHWLKQNTPESP